MQNAENLSKPVALTILAFIVTLGIGLRLAGLPEECIWWDEHVAYRFLSEPTLSSFLTKVRGIDAPMAPVYFVLEYAWARAGFNSVYALRWLSVIPGIAAIPLLYYFGAMHYGRLAGLVAAFLLACSKQHIMMSQELRVYALLTLLALCSSIALWRAWHRSEKISWILYGVVNAILLNTHLFAILVLFAHAAYLLGHIRRRAASIGVWTLVNLPGILLLLLWMRSFDPDATRKAASWITPPPIGSLIDILFVVYAGNRFSIGDAIWHRLTPFPVHWLTAGSFIALLCYLGYRTLVPLFANRPVERGVDPQSFAFLTAWYLVPPVTLFVASYILRPCLVDRYTLYCALPLFIMIGGAIRMIPTRWGQAAVMLSIVCFSTYHLATFERPIRLNWAGAASILNGRVSSTDKLILPAAICREPLREYLPWSRDRFVLNGNFKDADLQTRQIDAALEVADTGAVAWILTYTVFDYRVVDFERKLKERGIPIERWDTEGYRTVTLYRIARGAEVSEAPPSQPSTGPNCLFVVLDAVAAKHLRPWGYARETTPQIDRLSERGAVFTSAFSQSAATFSSVPSYWTGMNPASLQFAITLPDDVVVIPEAFQSIGFRTAGFSENPNVNETRGYARGFDTFQLYLPKSVDRTADGFSLDSRRTMRDVTEWIARSRDEPWFCYVHLLRPHDPYNSPEPYGSLFTSSYEGNAEGNLAWFRENGFQANPRDTAHLIDLYDGNLAYADHLVGELLSQLDQWGELEDTWVVLTSDHGEAFMQHGRLTHATTCYDEMIHVPLVIVPPHRAEYGAVTTDALIDLTCLFPTLAEVYGFDVPQTFDGVSLIPLMQGQELAGKPLIYSQAMQNASDLKPNLFAARTAEHKYVARIKDHVYERPIEFTSEELYDLVSDPGEQSNLLLDPERAVAGSELHQNFRRRVYEYIEAGGTEPGSEEENLREDVRDSLRALGYVD
jgi:arylsulfatase A-like enzyme